MHPVNKNSQPPHTVEYERDNLTQIKIKEGKFTQIIKLRVGEGNSGISSDLHPDSYLVSWDRTYDLYPSGSDKTLVWTRRE